MHCLYNAKTELYDRSLTDMRDKYDPTSAYVHVSYDVRSKSIFYAQMLYRWCQREIEYKTGKPFNLRLWMDCTRRYRNLSAQCWIDLYYLIWDKKNSEDIKNSKDNLRKE